MKLKQIVRVDYTGTADYAAFRRFFDDCFLIKLKNDGRITEDQLAGGLKHRRKRT